MVGFEERFHGKEGVKVENRDGVKNCFLGVDKQGKKWRARTTNPFLRTRVHLGHYGTPEEAALAVLKKNAEFEEMFKGQKSSSMGTCSGYCRGKKFHGKEGVEVETRDGVSGVKKRFLGVEKRGNRWRARARNPLLRGDVHLGYYKTPEEAALVVQKKKAEFEEMFKRQRSSSVGTCRGYFEGKRLPWGWGVRRQNGRGNRVHIRHSQLKKREEFQEMYRGKVGKLIVMSGDAISSFNRKKAEFDAKLRKPEFDCAEFMPGSEANESPMKFGNELGYDRPASLLSAHKLNNDDILGKLGGVGLVHGSPTSVFDFKNINTPSVADKTFDSEFDRAVSLGIINEYGRLLGKYSELDTETWLSSTE